MSTTRTVLQLDQNDKPDPYYQEHWREPSPHDRNAAATLRTALGYLGAFPYGTLTPDTNATHGAVCAGRKLALGEIIDELSPNDMAAVFEVARWLAIGPK